MVERKEVWMEGRKSILCSRFSLPPAVSLGNSESVFKDTYDIGRYVEMLMPSLEYVIDLSLLIHLHELRKVIVGSQPIRMAIIKKSTNNKCWRRCGENGTLLHCWWECKLVQPLWKTVWRFLKKLKIELPNDPAIPLLGTYPDKTVLQKDTCTPMFISSTIYNSQDMETT